MHFHKYRGSASFDITYVWRTYTGLFKGLQNMLIFKYLQSSSTRNSCVHHTVAVLCQEHTYQQKKSGQMDSLVMSALELSLTKNPHKRKEKSRTATASSSRVWSPWAWASCNALSSVISPNLVGTQLPINPVPPVATTSGPSRQGFGPMCLINIDSAVFSQH